MPCARKEINCATLKTTADKERCLGSKGTPGMRLYSLQLPKTTIANFSL